MGLLTDKVAIITGAGRGIGLATAKVFAAEGASVVINDLDVQSATEAATIIREQGGRASVISGDITDATFSGKLMQATLDTFGTWDIIVNNAGYAQDAALQNTTDQQWDAMLDIHVTAPFRLLREASHPLREIAKREMASYGRIMPRKVVNVTSISGVHGNPGQTSYSTAKAGVVGLTKTLAKEWGRYNVQVNCVCFGFIETRMTASIQVDEQVIAKREAVGGLSEKIRQQILSTIPLRRSGTPEEAAGAMLFLASPLSNYVSGVVLQVTGGGDM